MGIASLIIGIFALIFACIPAINWLGTLLGIIGIILGALGKKKNQSCSTAGLVLSIIATALGLVLYLACVACVSSASMY